MISRTFQNESAQVTLALIDRIVLIKAKLRQATDEQRPVYEQTLAECLAIKQRMVDRRTE